MTTDVDEVLSFWLGPELTTEGEVAARRKLWFASDQNVDREIRDRFGGLVERARADQLDAWADSPRGALALIVLIDQFSRNIYRGSGEAFARDDKALRLATQGYDVGLFGELGPVARLFAAMPFHHAEDLESQKRGVRLAVHDALGAQPPFRPFLVLTVDSARKHLDVIARFGRFPHRNAVLGRPSTPEEEEYLEYLKLAGQWL